MWLWIISTKSKNKIQPRPERSELAKQFTNSYKIAFKKFVNS